MSLVGMLKQYATGGQASNEATERLFSPMKRGGNAAAIGAGGVVAPENARQTRRRSEDRGYATANQHNQQPQ